MSSEDDKNKNAAGFAGLSSLVSDVEIDTDAPKSMPAPPVSAKQEVPDEEQKSATSTQQSSQTQSTVQPYQTPAQPSNNSGWKWVLGIGAVIAVIWMVAVSGSKNQAPPSYSSSPSVPSYSPPAATPAAPIRLPEELPPVATNTVLSSAQLRYCLAEDIRLESAKAAVNSYIDSHVDHFNGMVSDYNSRCGQFRYRKGALESARSEVERYRADLQAEGRGRFSTGTSSPKPTPQVVKPSPDPIVKSIQQRLNALGFDAGTADGFIGSKTRVAIIAFQRERGLTQDGAADETLLRQLGTYESKSSKEEAISIPRPIDSGSKKLEPPANAFVSGSNWYCKEGFRKVGDHCQEVIVPANAFVSGSNWYCKEGFRKAGDRCDAITVPQNAFVSGSNWYCKEGFRKVGDHCQEVIVPANAFVSGSNWYCKEGFRKAGDRCVSILDK